MNPTTKISALQFYLMLFLSRMVVGITINAQTVGGENFLKNIFSSLLLCVLLFLFAQPLFAMHKRAPEASLPALAEMRMQGIGCGIAAIYAVYFVVMNTFCLSLFLMLLNNTMDPTASTFSIALVILAIALFGAVKGIETVSRASICVFSLFFLGMAVIFIALLPNVNTQYTEPLFLNGTDQLLRGFFVFAARCSSLAEFAVLMPFVQKNSRKGFSLWNGGVTLFLGILLFFVVSCLGEYAYLQIFPVYTLSSIAEIAGVQRLDALFMGLCMMTLVIRLAVGLFAISECCARFVRKNQSRALLLAAATLVTLMAATWITADYERFRDIFKTEYLLVLTVLTGVILPLLVFTVDRFRRGGGTK